MEPISLFQQLALSALLGLLVGMQRERTQSYLAGIRTFPLISVFGTVCTVFATEFDSPWILPTGLLGIVGLIVTGNLDRLRRSQPDLDHGVTTEITMLLMFLLGGFVVVGPWSVAVAVTGGMAILLHLKPVMHETVRKLGDQDFRAILQFVLITFIILPVLPNRDYDPFDPLRSIIPTVNIGEHAVLNPSEIWLMVVLVVAISLGGYLIYKFFGKRAGILLGGILGGTISSTATTVSYARRTSNEPESAGMATIAVLIASTVVFVRVLLEISVKSPGFLRIAAGPILAMFAVATLVSIVAWLVYRSDQTDMPEPSNPSELRSAIVFAAVYGFVLLAVSVAKSQLQDQGLYAVAIVSGMTDMDAITLSTSTLVASARLDPQIGWRVIVIATMSNLVFKTGIVLFLGHRSLLRKVGTGFTIIMVCGIAILIWWPAVS